MLIKIIFQVLKTNVSAHNNTRFVDTVRYSLASSFANGVFDSCKKVSFLITFSLSLSYLSPFSLSFSLSYLSLFFSLFLSFSPLFLCYYPQSLMNSPCQVKFFGDTLAMSVMCGKGTCTLEKWLAFMGKQDDTLSIPFNIEFKVVDVSL